MSYAKPCNLGTTGLRRKRRSLDPMQTFDALPQELRHWLSEAVLPWSPSSAGRIWCKARREGLSTEQTVQKLADAEARTLARDTLANKFMMNTQS
ncbi:MAG: DUF6525 family protein [Pseudomonadota bacterium]